MKENPEYVQTNISILNDANNISSFLSMDTYVKKDMSLKIMVCTVVFLSDFFIKYLILDTLDQDRALPIEVAKRKAKNIWIAQTKFLPAVG
jgi:hypothetical protein